MEDKSVLEELFEVVKLRKTEPQEGSYTCYLFNQGIDKILKKVGEETSEVIIASKNDVKEDKINEVCDLLYHLVVLMVEQGIELSEIEENLRERSKKIGNLKQMKVTDKNT